MNDEIRSRNALARVLLDGVAKHILAMVEDGEDHDTWVFNEGIEAAAAAVTELSKRFEEPCRRHLGPPAKPTDKIPPLVGW